MTSINSVFLWNFLRNVFFTKHPSGWRSTMLLKIHSNTNAFLEISKTFKSIFFTEHLLRLLLCWLKTGICLLSWTLVWLILITFSKSSTRHSVQISLFILSKFQQVNQLLHLKPSENLRLSLNLFHIRCEFGDPYLKLTKYNKIGMHREKISSETYVKIIDQLKKPSTKFVPKTIALITEKAAYIKNWLPWVKMIYLYEIIFAAF